MRRKIAEHLVKSKHTAPHFTYVEEADMTDIVKFRNDLQTQADALGIKLTFLPFIIKAVIEGLKKYPALNSTLDETTQEIILKHYYNMGVAVATPDGLVVPVVTHAEQRSILDLAAEIASLGDKARQGKLALTDLQGGTFTLTSIGSIGGIFSAPIINYPEVAIMGIQKIEKRPVVRNDEIVIREMTYFSISCDHRVVDGAEAALFMKEVIDWLEHPGRFLLSGV
jgi:pyruvate dehydrogenase E2 component (dihydrolipoamide acetyltransferase)